MTVDTATGPSASPWGVQLKKTPKGRNPVPNTRRSRSSRRLKEDAKAEEGIQQQRSSLRKVNLPPRNTGKRRSRSRKRYSRPGARGWKKRQAGSPLLGVVLQTINEEEEFMDLDLMPAGGSHHSISSSSSSSKAKEFGVRLKPNRQFSTDGPINAKKALRTYQIDLNPTQKLGSGLDKSFLEVKLRPFSSKTEEDDDDNASVSSQEVTATITKDKVEFQVRHVVAPADGGPKQTTSEAVFQVPLFQPVGPVDQRKNWKSTTDSGLQDLLQISIQDLEAPSRNEDTGETHQSLQLQIRQVDPETQETHTMEHSIDISLQRNGNANANCTAEGDDEEEPENPWKMMVELKPVEVPSNRWGNGSTHKDAALPPNRTIHMRQPPRRPTRNYDDEEDQDETEFTEFHYDDEVDDGASTTSSSISQSQGSQFEEDHSCGTEPTLNMSGSNLSLADEDAVGDGNQEDSDHSSGTEPTLSMSEPTLSLADEDDVGDANKDDSDDESTVHGMTTDDDSSSSSSSDSDSDSDSDDEEEEEEKPPAPLPTRKKRDLLMWYNRMSMPSKETMKKKVLALPKSCDITPQDVEQLPWLAGGKFLNIRVMNQMFLDDWQGDDDDGEKSKKKKKLPARAITK